MQLQVEIQRNTPIPVFMLQCGWSPSELSYRFFSKLFQVSSRLLPHFEKTYCFERTNFTYSIHQSIRGNWARPFSNVIQFSQPPYNLLALLSITNQRSHSLLRIMNLYSHFTPIFKNGHSLISRFSIYLLFTVMFISMLAFPSLLYFWRLLSYWIVCWTFASDYSR